MNKLQLYIYKAVRGFKSVQNINPAENIQRHIRDVRGSLELIDYDPTEKYLFYLLSYINEGTFFTILRTIPDKPLDHLASTIFIPNGLQISSDELVEVVNRTARMVSNPTVTAEDITELHELFSKEYAVEEDVPAMVESDGSEYAFSYYGGDTLRRFEDFLGRNIYQTKFIGYSGVLLVDADLGVTVEAPDLTDEPLCEPAVLCPPDEMSKGFAPFIFNRPFNRCYRVSLGTEVDVVWKRKGFNDIEETVAITEPHSVLPLADIDDSRKIITRSIFYITANGGKQTIDNAEISVNGVDITGEHLFSFDDLKNANVVVRAKGFRPYQATLDLAATSQALISLHEQRRVYCFELPVKSSELGSPIRFEIHTKRHLTESPLEGYTLVDGMREGTGRYNHLQFTSATVGIPVRQAVVFVGAALLAGFLLGWLLMGGGSSKTEDSSTDTVEQTIVEVSPAPTPSPEPAPKQTQEPTPTPAPAPVSVQPDAPVTSEAIAYLEANQSWTQESLDKQPGLAGLYDDMNNYRLERLVNHWGPRLAKSKRFSKVAYHAGESLRKKIFKPEGTYCSDGKIGVQAYLYRIDPAKK